VAIDLVSSLAVSGQDPVRSRRARMMVSLQDLANLGEAIGGLAVLVTLVYLGLQLRLNTRAVRAATYQQVVEATSEWSAMMSQNDDLVLLWAKATEDGLDSLSSPEALKFWFCLMTLPGTGWFHPVRGTVVICLLTGGTEKGPSFSYSPPTAIPHPFGALRSRGSHVRVVPGAPMIPIT
jgi:hypothetical protein